MQYCSIKLLVNSLKTRHNEVPVVMQSYVRQVQITQNQWYHYKQQISKTKHKFEPKGKILVSGPVLMLHML